MLSIMLKAKLHGPRVTASDLDYEGSLTIDQDLMDYVRILPYEKILVSNMANGSRFETYAIPGKRGAGDICLNGATAHLGKVGDKITIFTFGLVPTEEAAQYRPRVLRIGPDNKPEGGLKPV